MNLFKKSTRRYQQGQSWSCQPRFESLEQRQLLTSVIFDDALNAPWQNWSWGSDIDLQNTTGPVQSGSNAVAVTYESGWAGFFVGSDEGIDLQPEDEISFAVHGGESNEDRPVWVSLYLQDNSQLFATEVTLTDSWNMVTIDLGDLGSPEHLNGLIIQDASGQAQPTFYVDNIMVEDTIPETPNENITVVYDDDLASGWGDWSWSTTIDFQNATPRLQGNHSLQSTHNAAWAGLYLGNAEGIAISSIDEVSFAIHGGDAAKQMVFYVVDEGFNFIEAASLSVNPGRWENVLIDLDEIGAPSPVTGLVWQDASGSPGGPFFLDQILIGDLVDDGAPQTGNGPEIRIDPSDLGRSISDEIYGLNFAEDSLAADIALPVNRWGGNATTRYNFQIDATNLASDWYFENYPSDNPDTSQLPVGSSADRFIANDSEAGTETIMTIGMTGWAPKSRDIIGSFSVEKYGPQQDADPYRPEHGNGIRLDGTPISGNDPYDTSVPVDEQFAADWIEHLKSQFGTADDGGVQYYALDNEPMLWNHTHRDVHPEPASYDEVFDKGKLYASTIKQIDPSAQVMGPTVWGWTAYFYSALDAEGDGAWWENPQDQNAHGGTAFLPWYLQQMATAEDETGTRLLDYLDIHYYPQDAGVALSPAGSKAVQESRLKSTRSLWDPEYVDETWINTEIQLIPRMREWIDDYYPGTKLAITEYNWGGVDHINGAITQADVLGIFGREGVDLATMWDPPATNEPTAYSFRMFRNYDGLNDDGSRFGDRSVTANSQNDDQVSVFAAQRQVDDALTIILINKTDSMLDTPISLPVEFDLINAEVYTYDASNLQEIVRGDDLLFDDGNANIALPGYSITLLELPAANDVNQPPALNVGTGEIIVDEGTIAELSGGVVDESLDSVSLTASMGSIEMGENGAFRWYFDAVDDLAETTVTLTATDSSNQSATADFQFAIRNVAPKITTLTLPDTAIEFETISVEWSTFDPGIADSVSTEFAVISESDGAVVSSGVVESNEPTRFEFVPEDAEQYTISLRVYDDDGGSQSQQRVIAVDELFSVNLGSQRSTIRKIEVDFATIVTFDSPAFRLERINKSNEVINEVELSTEVSSVDGRTHVVLTFGGNETEFGSLVDGDYRLTVLPNTVRVGTNLVETSSVDEFYRYFGDKNGNRKVDLRDIAKFMRVYGLTENHNQFDEAFDFDDDGQIGIDDLIAIATRFVARRRSN